MDYTTYTKETNIPFQTFSYDDFKKITIEDNESTVNDESSTVINEEGLRAAKGIICALIFCIPFWLFLLSLLYG